MLKVYNYLVILLNLRCLEIKTFTYQIKIINSKDLFEIYTNYNLES